MSPSGDKRIIAMQQPVGVSVLVTPWNFPAAMATRKIAPALAAGCTVVLKPASDTPLTALLIGDLLTDAGVPAGVVNVLPSRRSGASVGTMLADPRVRKVSFTGSTEVGRTLLEQAAQQVLNCSMELGGNGPFVVLEDADLDAAVEGAMVAKMRNGGESCIAANRFVVHTLGRRRVLATAVRADGGRSRSVRGWTAATTSARSSTRAPARRSPAWSTGRSPAARSCSPAATCPSGEGWFYPPTVLAGVDAGDPLLDHEIFGPVAPITEFTTDDQALELANATEFGLAAYVYSGDLVPRVCASPRASRPGSSASTVGSSRTRPHRSAG